MNGMIAQTRKNLKDPMYMAETVRVMTTVFMILSALLMVLGGNIRPVSAAEEIAGAELGKMFSVFKGLSNLFIKFAYGAMVLIFAVGMVKSGLTAQAAQQFGAAGKVSNELMNVLGGIVIFVFGLLSYPIAEKIISAVISGAGASGGFQTDNLDLPGIGR
ncbi:MAG: hypothetical protein K5852_00650 [Eubacterium sp.]|nr:hypothetical protein [Eubacterium sp.]